MRFLAARLARLVDDMRARVRVRARLAEDREVEGLEAAWDCDWLPFLEGWWAL